MPERDLFANFDRMRREMDELFGDMLQSPARRSGRWPAVDVAYTSEPPRAVVTADLAGVDIRELELHIEGRTLILAGVRAAARPEGDVYQQVEIARGPFRRVVELLGEVHADRATASYEDGMLRVELPLARRPPRLRAVPIQGRETR